MGDIKLDEKKGGKPFYKSKKWWAAAIAAVIPVLNQLFGLSLSPIELAAVILPLVGYVLGESWIDAKH
jgi:hypothetical protein